MYLVQYIYEENNTDTYFYNQLENAKKKFKELKNDMELDPKRTKEEILGDYIEITDTSRADRLVMYKITTND